MNGALRIALAQIDPTVGNAPGNADRAIRQVAPALAQGARLLVLPELMLSGYPEYTSGTIYNTAAWLRGGACIARYRKQVLPNYQVFDEKRYFSAGTAPVIVELDGIRIAPLICEDVWHAGPAAAARAAGAGLCISLNASPYQQGKQPEREAALARRARETGMPFIYVNLVGAQDELVFDGNSFAVDETGRLVHRAPAFEESLSCVEATRVQGGAQLAPESLAPLLAADESVYRAIVTGVRDYVGKHDFSGVVLGLSGGVDSALVLAIACDALGAERVHAVMLPSRYTSSMSEKDAATMARGLGVRYSVISIEGMFQATLAALQREFQGRAPDSTEENIQARCRGIVLMAISNKTGRMLLTTGNKSEMAVGYATLYGDMAGGYAPI